MSLDVEIPETTNGLYICCYIRFFLLVVWYFTKVSNLSYLKPTLVLFLWVFSHFLYKRLFKKERWKIKDMNTYGKTTLKAVEGELRGIIFKFIKTFYTFSLMSIFPEQFYFILLNNCLVQIYHILFKQFFYNFTFCYGKQYFSENLFSLHSWGSVSGGI